MGQTDAIKRMEREIESLSSEDLLMLLDEIVHRLKKSLRPPPTHDWDKLYGAGSGLWKEDAQSYVERLREDR